MRRRSDTKSDEIREGRRREKQSWGHDTGLIAPEEGELTAVRWQPFRTERDVLRIKLKRRMSQTAKKRQEIGQKRETDRST